MAFSRNVEVMFEPFAVDLEVIPQFINLTICLNFF